jgi:hypothetical protein
MSFSLSISPYNLYGNAVPLHITADASTDFTYSVKSSSENEIFSGSATGQDFDIQLQDIVKTLVSAPDPKWMSAVTAIFAAVSNFVSAFSVAVSDGTNTNTVSAKVVYGGIPNRILRTLKQSGTDILHPNC